jgi:hydrogenase maturation protein HypF
VAFARSDVVERLRLRVRGVVQGVGFRPFVHRLATSRGLAGFVLNDGEGVIVEIEGAEAALAAFSEALELEAPPLARIDSVTAERVPVLGERGFVVAESRSSGRSALIPPDVATCDACLAELFDPGDRRYRYPFGNCTDCGPRFTIVVGVPYDRARTTMAGFPLCADCRREYEDPADRRFHAEPIACPACGPRLSAPLEDAVKVLVAGGIVAVKGLGGYHLACDATSEDAVARLRARKGREEKPLAVMTGEPGLLASLTPDEDALLRSPARPIVLARRRAAAPVAESVAPGSPCLGLMLPYTPLHHLLCSDTGRPLVMTSGNLSDEPIAFDDADASNRLGSIADLVLSHDRPIHRRCEDSVWRAGFPIRRSRGHTPSAIGLPVAADRPLVAAGAELKSTFCVARGGEAFLSAHLGDLTSEEAYRAFRADLELYLDTLGVEPSAVACDLHPDYLSTRWAWEQGLPVEEVQHHHAHAAACLAEHGETGPALAVVLDGTGFGADGTVWGGEVLRCDLLHFERVAHLEAVPLPGGDAAVREPWRIAAAHLERAGRPVPWERWKDVRQSLGVNAPLSSGAGRLFDAVSALLGVRERVTYEGQAAIGLEHLADNAEAEPYACRLDRPCNDELQGRVERLIVQGERDHGWAEAPRNDELQGVVVRGSDLVAAAYDDLAAGRDRAEIAAAFHEGVATAFAEACASADGADTVVLSGGCFQNARLLTSTRRRLEAHGFRVLSHALVPPNDAGVSYGQAAVAAARLASCA